MTGLRDKTKSRRYLILVMISRISWVRGGYKYAHYGGRGDERLRWSVFGVCFVPSECWGTFIVLSLPGITAKSMLHFYQPLSHAVRLGGIFGWSSISLYFLISCFRKHSLLICYYLS